MAGVHAAFRNEFIDSEWTARGKMFERLKLKPEPDYMNGLFKDNLRWMLTRPNGGLFFADVRGQSEASFYWHTIGFYFGVGKSPAQFFDPEIGLYQWDDGKEAALRAVVPALREQIPDFAGYSSVCHHFPFMPT